MIRWFRFVKNGRIVSYLPPGGFKVRLQAQGERWGSHRYHHFAFMSALHLLGGCLFLHVLFTLSYRLLRSPLAKLPGPRITATTNLWLVSQEFTHRRRKWIHKLHLKYGPIVRIAPNEVSFASWDAANEIYASGGSGYDKTTLYTLFENFNKRNIFSTLEKAPHAEAKKQFADRYTKNFVMQPDVRSGIQEIADQFVTLCTDTPSKAVDIYIHTHCYAIDCVTYHLFHPFGLRSLTQPSDREIMKQLSYADDLISSYLRYYFPALSGLFKRLLGPSTSLAASYVMKSVRRTDVASDSVLHKLQTVKNATNELSSVASECMDHLIAGIVTAGDSLCCIIHHLSLDSSLSIQEKLYQELSANPNANIDDLPYLDAVVKEGLRRFDPVAMSLPRKVPAGGRTINGVYIPGDVIVSCQAYTMHRLDTEVFPNPEAFIPERWIDTEGAIGRNHLFFAFSTGGRGCIGKNLALLEMKTLLREIYSTCRTRVAREMKACMELEDQVISSRPKDLTCLIVFEKIN